MFQHHVRDTVLLSGWLFADLLLGLMVIFLASIQPPPPPRMTVAPQVLKPGDKNCTGEANAIFECHVQLSGIVQTLGVVHWIASTDIKDIRDPNNPNLPGIPVGFLPQKGDLAAGSTTTITISHIPCQNGSFTFSGQTGVFPVTVAWLCTLAPDSLKLQYEQFFIQIPDVQGLLNDDEGVSDNIKQQVRQQPLLQGNRVGLVIVYGGAPTSTVDDTLQAAAISQAVYNILRDMGQKERFPPLIDASQYDAVHALGQSANMVTIQVYMFKPRMII